MARPIEILMVVNLFKIYVNRSKINAECNIRLLFCGAACLRQ